MDPEIDRRDDEDFENFVERAFHHLNERLDDMADGIAGLEADEATLAVVIPEIVTELGTLHSGLAAAEAAAATAVAAAQAAEATATADSAELATAQTELAKAQGELAAVQTVKTALDPLVAQAQALVPAAPAPVERDAAGMPLYTLSGDPATADLTAWTKSTTLQAPGPVALYTFNGDAPGGTPAGTGAGWAPYTGATEAVAAPVA